MGYKYNASSTNPSPYIPFKTRRAVPTDERLVVTTRAALVDRSTWGYQDPNVPVVWINHTYDGIIVTVVDDPVASNNGVYWLKKREKYTYFADLSKSDPDYATLFDADGWRKIGGSVPAEINVDNYTIKDGGELALPTDTPPEPLNALHVVRVDGGTFD